MVWFIVDVAARGYSIVTRWMFVNSHSGCFIPDKVFFDTCATVGMLVRGSFLKDGGEMPPSSFGNLLQCV